MNIQRIANRRDNFAFKLSAAKYHLIKIKEVFKAEKELIIKGEIDLPATRPLIYHYYSIIYELYSCFDMTLHFINEKLNLGFAEKDIQWKSEAKKTKFQKKLQEESLSTYKQMRKIMEEDWFITLRDTRNYLLHNGIIILQLEYNNKQINIINPIINGKILNFDLNLWGERMSEFFNSLYK